MSKTCEHLQGTIATPHASKGCEDCLKIGGHWVHLRSCTTCGHVGCCDSSPNRHARAHFNGQHHPAIRSVEPGETWTYCYQDDAYGELA